MKNDDKKPSGAPPASSSVKKLNKQVVQSFSHGRSKVVTIEIKRKRQRDPSSASYANNGAGTLDTRFANKEQENRFKALEESLNNPQEDLLNRLKTESSLLKARTEAEKKKNEAKTQKEKEFAIPANVPVEDLTQGKDSAFKGGQGKFQKKEFDEPPVPTKSKKQLAKEKEQKRDHKNLARFYHADAEPSSLASSIADHMLEENASVKRAKKASGFRLPSKKNREVVLPEKLTVKELAGLMAEKIGLVLKKALALGLDVKINQTIDAATAELIVLEMGHTATLETTHQEKLDKLLSDASSDDSDKKPRPPVITIMGHVDHGKTSLLDALRKTNITGGEAGGITQHIGAYQIENKQGQKLTFIDTPGHEAFTHMRARGAHITDIVILLVAADDGVKEQTIEAIGHAKASGAPIVLVINKIDKPDAKPERVRQELLGHEIVVESLGGEILDVEVSAKTGQGLDKLIDTLLLQAELLELKARSQGNARATVLEAKLDKKRGALATILVQDGLLRKGDRFVSGKTSGRVRLILDDRGKSQEKALPAQPVEVLGFTSTPFAGDDFIVTKNEAHSQEILSLRMAGQPDPQKTKAPNTLEKLLKGQTQDIKELSLIIKADTQGSLEAVCASLERIAHDEVKVKILHRHVGAITDSDINLAQVSGALLIGFGVATPSALIESAKSKGVEIQNFNIIYQLIETIKDLLGGLLTPEKKEVILGHAAIRQIFATKKFGKIAGCYVTDGLLRKGSLARALRKDKVLHESHVSSLKREANDAKEVKEKYECGICLDGFDAFEIGDVIEAFEIQNVKRSLED